jgi:hypothetical protein
MSARGGHFRHAVAEIFLQACTSEIELGIMPEMKIVRDEVDASGSLLARYRITELCIVSAYLAAALAALAYSRGALKYSDEREYLVLGQNLLQYSFYTFDGIHPTAFRPPGYPALIAGLWAIWPSIYILKIFNLLCWAATGLVVGRVAAALWGVQAGYLGAFLFLIYLPDLYAATTLYPQPVVGLLIILSAALIWPGKRLAVGSQALLFVLTTIQVLMVVNCIVPAALLYTFAGLRRQLSIQAIVAAWCLLVLILLGICYINQNTVGAFALTTNFGLNLVQGYNDNAMVDGGALTDISAVAAQTGSGRVPFDPAWYEGMSEAARNDFFKWSAIHWIESHPGRALYLFIARLLHWFAYQNYYAVPLESRTLYAVAAGIMFITYYPLLFAAALATWLSEKPVRRSAAIAWTVYLGAAFSYAIFYTRIRFRLPFDPLLIALAPAAIFSMAQRLGLNVARTRQAP